MQGLTEIIKGTLTDLATKNQIFHYLGIEGIPFRSIRSCGKHKEEVSFQAIKHEYGEFILPLDVLYLLNEEGVSTIFEPLFHLILPLL
jgi:hypothetical protein